MLASETYSFSLGYHYDISPHMLFQCMKLEIKLYVFTDCESIFDTITASKRFRELRLMNEIADIRRAYRQGEITNVAWIRSEKKSLTTLPVIIATTFYGRLWRQGLWIPSLDNAFTRRT